MTYTIDRSESQLGMEINAPDWFVNPLRGFVIRNGIKTDPRMLCQYLELTYEENKDWLTQDNIVPVLKKIGENQKWAHLPEDNEWGRWKPKETDPDIELLRGVTYFLEDALNDKLGIKPELDPRQQAALEYAGGWNGLIGYADRYSISSAIRLFKDALEKATDWGFTVTVGTPRIGAVSIGKLLTNVKNDSEKIKKPQESGKKIACAASKQVL